MGEIIQRDVEIGSLATILAKVTKLQNRAVKLGLPRFKVVSTGEITRREYLCQEWFGTDKTVMSAPPAADGPWRVVRVYQYTTVGIESVTVGLAGWTFVGTLSYFDTEKGREVLVAAVPGQEIPPAFRTGTPDRCDHCNTTRYRVETFVVREDATGEHRQVGRQCLAAFLGTDPSQVMSASRLLGAMDEDDFWSGDSRGEPAWPLEAFLGCVVHSIRAHGWTSRGAARNDYGKVATADEAMQLLDPTERGATPYAPTADEMLEVRRCLEWHADNWADLPEPNDYQHNLGLGLRLGIVVRKTVGIVASLISVANREMDKLRERAANEAARATGAASRHLGTVGERITLDVTVTGTRWIESNWGSSCLVTMQDADGNKLKWFASDPGSDFIDATGPIRITATVKKHDDWKGEAQTLVTRAGAWTQAAIEAQAAKDARKAAKVAKAGAR